MFPNLSLSAVYARDPAKLLERNGVMRALHTGDDLETVFFFSQNRNKIIHRCIGLYGCIIYTRISIS